MEREKEKRNVRLRGLRVDSGLYYGGWLEGGKGRVGSEGREGGNSGKRGGEKLLILL